MTMVAGCDPGMRGGVAVLSSTNMLLVGARTATHCPRPDIWFRELGVKHVFVEKAQSMPKQGIASAFNYGCGFGRLLGLFESGDFAVTLVTPREWTKAVHGGTSAKGDTKRRSLERARQLWPSQEWLESPRCSKPHDGLFEAALIAYYGLLSLTRGT